MRLPIVWSIVGGCLAMLLAAGSTWSAPPAAAVPEGVALRTAVREALSATLKQPQPDAAGVARLSGLYRTLQVDTSLPRNQRESLRLAVRTRLKSWETWLKSNSAPAADIKAASASVLARQAVLGQAPVGQPAPIGKAPILAQQAPPGGPAQPQATQPPVDHSQELLEVIQDTISPDSWDVRGGRGVIRFWPPGQALVVRQTGEVHESLAHLLNDLRQ